MLRLRARDAAKLGVNGVKTPHKHGAERTVVYGVSFASKREAQYYAQLVLEKRVGAVLWFARQAIFDLPGGVHCKLDFIVCRPNTPGQPEHGYYIEIVDPKGQRTKEWIRNKKQLEALNPITIREV